MAHHGSKGPPGELSEWLKVPDSKSGVPRGTGGSNPSLSAKATFHSTRSMERCPSWLKVLAWKAGVPQKGTRGSNPRLSATRLTESCLSGSNTFWQPRSPRTSRLASRARLAATVALQTPPGPRGSNGSGKAVCRLPCPRREHRPPLTRPGGLCVFGHQSAVDR